MKKIIITILLLSLVGCQSQEINSNISLGGGIEKIKDIPVDKIYKKTEYGNIVDFLYYTDEKVGTSTIKRNGKTYSEDIKKRLPFASFYDRGNREKTVRLYIIDNFKKVDKEWYKVYTATTTIEDFNNKTKVTNILSFINTANADVIEIDYSYLGSTYLNNASWANARGGTTADSVSNNNDFFVRSSSDYIVERGIMKFYTGIIPAGSTIDSGFIGGVVDFKFNNDADGNDYITFTETTIASSTTIVTTDHDEFTDTELTTNIDLDDITAGVETQWNLNTAGKSYIVTGSSDDGCGKGMTCFMMREGHDINNDAPSNSCGILFKPKTESPSGYLEIDYTEASPVPVGTKHINVLFFN